MIKVLIDKQCFCPCGKITLGGCICEYLIELESKIPQPKESSSQDYYTAYCAYCSRGFLTNVIDNDVCETCEYGQYGYMYWD